MSRAVADQASQIVDSLVDHGARFTYRAAAGALPPSFTYELIAGGDRQACRRAIAEAKGEAALWQALVAEIGARSRRGQ